VRFSEPLPLTCCGENFTLETLNIQYVRVLPYPAGMSSHARVLDAAPRTAFLSALIHGPPVAAVDILLSVKKRLGLRDQGRVFKGTGLSVAIMDQTRRTKNPGTMGAEQKEREAGVCRSLISSASKSSVLAVSRRLRFGQATVRRDAPDVADLSPVSSEAFGRELHFVEGSRRSPPREFPPRNR